jgi:2'-5' RNA ligase
MQPKIDLTDVYAEMGVNVNGLGCIMLETEPLTVNDIIAPEDLYYASDPNKFWINGIVCENVPHCTLLYGLMESGQSWRIYVDKTLEGWEPGELTIDHVSFFDTPFGEGEPYYCIVAHLEITPELLDANARLRRLPHIDGYPDYRAHITIAYIKRDEALRDDIIYALNNRFMGQTVAAKGLNYGK